MVELDDIIVRDVLALVQPDESLGVNLLGMSFLSRVRWTHERGKLILDLLLNLLQWISQKHSISR